jgi:hypothetical protein
MIARVAIPWMTVAIAACTHGDRPGTAEVRSYYYTDNSGLDVTTFGAHVEQPVGRSTTMVGQFLTDHITLFGRQQIDPGTLTLGGFSAGHPPHTDPDVVTSASAIVSNGHGKGSDKRRYEAVAALETGDTMADHLVSGRISARVSEEPDFHSVAGTLSGSVELFKRNTVISGSIGYGRDRIVPLQDPPGQAASWPATQQRVNAGATVTQLLSPTLSAMFGVRTNVQRGMLANPYRRAIVRTTLFPEVVPDARDRVTAFAALAWSVTRDVALHLRQGAYADSWRVRALIPEGALAVELGEPSMLTIHYRYYWQTRASFYQAIYDDILPIMSGDPRLGRLHEHTAGITLDYKLRGERDDPGSLVVNGSYDFSVLSYDDLDTGRVRAHVVSVALVGRY